MLWTVFQGVLCALMACTALLAQTNIDAGSLYKQASPAVVLIEGKGEDGKPAKVGSGLIVSTDGKLLTNYHVISHCKDATVRLANGDAYDIVEVIAVDKRKDIAFLKIPAVDLPTVKLGRSDKVEIGQTIYSIGSPLGLQNTLSQGLISGVRDMDGYKLFQISAPISHGSSGGPVFSADGSVVGIAVLTIEEGQNLNFAIPIDYARGFLGMSQTQPLAAVYEPEPAAHTEDSKALSSATATTSRLPIPEEMRKGPLVFLEQQMGHWTLADARHQLGDPVRQRDALVAGARPDGIIYAFPDPTNGFREFELNFSKSGVMRAVYGYPVFGTVTLRSAQVLWGRNYRETKQANGTITYIYKDRHLIIVTDHHGTVINIGVYLPQ